MASVGSDPKTPGPRGSQWAEILGSLRHIRILAGLAVLAIMSIGTPSYFITMKDEFRAPLMYAALASILVAIILAIIYELFGGRATITFTVSVSRRSPGKKPKAHSNLPLDLVIRGQKKLTKNTDTTGGASFTINLLLDDEVQIAYRDPVTNETYTIAIFENGFFRYDKVITI